MLGTIRTRLLYYHLQVPTAARIRLCRNRYIHNPVRLATETCNFENPRSQAWAVLGDLTVTF